MPIQNKLVASINILNEQLASLISLKQSGMSFITSKEVKEIKKKIKDAEMKLARYKFCQLKCVFLLYCFQYQNFSEIFQEKF